MYIKSNKFQWIISVRTIIELVKNKLYYENAYSKFIGFFDEALRSSCNNYSFCELYEIVALANVLKCDVQSVYPYIDYRAEMKIMNAVYEPIGRSVKNNGKLIIFWSNCEDEITVRSHPVNSGSWTPNHFVPLLQPSREYRERSVEQINLTPEVMHQVHKRKNCLNKNFTSLDSTKNNYEKQSNSSNKKSRVFTAS